MQPEITGLLQLSAEMPAYRQLIDRLGKPGGSTRVVVLDAARPYLIASLYHDLKRPLLVVTAQPQESKKLSEQLAAWTGSTRLRLFPEPDTLPYQRITSDTVTEMERLQILSALAGAGGKRNAPLTITSTPALMQKVAPYRDFSSTHHTIRVGDNVEPLSLLKRWQAMGYRIESTVEVPGTVSRRGGIIDIYPPSGDLPARLDFYGDNIDSIRLFDPVSQRSMTKVSEVAVTPATELLAPLSISKEELRQVLASINPAGCNDGVRRQLEQEMAILLEGEVSARMLFYAPLFNSDSILSYLPRNTLIVLNEPRSMASAAADLEAKAEELRTEKLERGELPAGFPRPYFTWHELEAAIAKEQCLAITAWDKSSTEETLRLNFTSTPSYAGQLPTFIRKAKHLQKQGHRLIIVSHQASRLSEILGEADIIAPPLAEIKEAPAPGSLSLIQGLLAEGWTMNGASHLFTDYEIFGFSKERRLTRKRPTSHQLLLNDLSPGDYVVHIEHGIARFSGVTTMESANTEKEYLVLQYAGGDRLYVPTDQIYRVSRYIGASEQPPVPSRLGTPEWNRTKQKARAAAEEIAEELLTLYAARGVVDGFSFSPDTVWQQELEASFPYLETPDQSKVQQQVKDDMAQPRPMDRLVCGDVGYGKTEIAIRAAFKAVMDNKQVAVLVPTTVLAQQHFSTFSQRLGAFPIRTEVLSRFKNQKEQNAIIDGLAKGNVDICIGTHRLLQKDIAFRDLGLVIIDEEQRFGVNHKEYLKQMRREVDVLTLSATPIPRTLHMSLVGVRDMSTIETPPEDRLPIKTFVAEYDDSLIREAVLRELERNGQVFFVHNRVQSIAMVAGRLEQLVPEARIAIAHGQMSETELEAVMTDFARSKIDILVCTTIIESGLDMPNVNTLIVNKADRFGLTQLYQLRGRIGRGTNLAYAYFLYDRGKQLTHTAERRLRTIFEATELGAGFNIAIKDLEIRGAGNLLGVKQSGQISAVGFNLYCRLLAEAVEREKDKRSGAADKPPAPSLPPPNIDLPLDTYIPEGYIADLNTRLSLYQRLADIKSLEELEDMAYECSDRFGRPPEEVANLLYAVRIKILAARVGVESVTGEHGQIILRLFPGMHFDKQRLAPLAGDGIKIGLTQIRLNTKLVGGRWQKVLEELLGRVG
ncbi:MAG: transcription-repair coupling factor [Dehalococcoidales bacterium]|nr:transcription-repair coupling factor [Dehalococcoidales bacterium]